ncbi:MAG: hypothetical protein U1E50_18670 [Caulobacteraceae bacterium]
MIWAVAEFSPAFDEAALERQLMDGWRNQAAVEAHGAPRPGHRAGGGRRRATLSARRAARGHSDTAIALASTQAR